MIKFLPLTFFFFMLVNSSMLLVSCSKDPKTRCEELSIKKYKGIPTASYEFDKHCKNIKIEFTQTKCQQVLERFILTGKKETIKKEFGQMAIQCLTQDDINRFQK